MLLHPFVISSLHTTHRLSLLHLLPKNPKKHPFPVSHLSLTPEKCCNASLSPSSLLHTPRPSLLHLLPNTPLKTSPFQTSPTMAAESSPHQIRLRVSHLLSKLSDRDTELSAAADLNSIIPTLSPSSLPPFISSISDIRSADKTPLRRHSLRLLSLLARSIPPSSLSPHIPRLLSAALRRLRDPDSSVRAAVVDAVKSLAAAVPRPSFVPNLLRPLVDALFHEQHIHSQSVSALSISASIEEFSLRGGDDDEDMLSDFLLRLIPRLVKLCRSPSFKAKAAVLALLGNAAVFAYGIGDAEMKALVNCLLEFLRSEDWAARNAAAVTLGRLAAAAEKDRLSELKSSCLAVFESRRYDKVKIVRDSISRMVEEWKQIPDKKLDDVKEMNSDNGSCPTTTTTTIKSSSCLQSPCRSKKISTGKSPPSAVPQILTSKKMESSNWKRNSKMIVEKRYSDRKTEIAVPDTTPPCAEDKSCDKPMTMERYAKGSQNNGRGRLEVKRALFEKNWENKENSGLKSGSRVLPLLHEIGISEEMKNESGVAGDREEEPKDDDDLCVIRMQLVQIENQQSSLLNLLQRFMGSSQNGMHSLEARVRGLEIVLDDMSRDIAASRGRGLNDDWGAKLCCRLPGAEILSSKFWRRAEITHPSRLLSYNESQRFGPRGGFINPLAEANPQFAGTRFV